MVYIHTFERTVQKNQQLNLLELVSEGRQETSWNDVKATTEEVPDIRKRKKKKSEVKDVSISSRLNKGICKGNYELQQEYL